MQMINPTIQAEFSKPGMNPFFAALAQAPRVETPVHKFHREVKALEKIAEAGDLQAWTAKVGQVDVLAQQAFEDPMKLLEAKVQVKKLELTLFVKASKSAIQQAETVEKQAKEAELTDNQASRALWMKAQQLRQMGRLFQDKLRAQLQTA
ncbi:MAG TPA: hypothetical protein VJR29_04335 [bacterium]|nr:hypothetical protein [bacterium]